MLSISNVKEGASAASYYEQTDDYYIRGQAKGGWFGHGADVLGLVGAVDATAFTEALGGQLPDGTRIHRAAGGHRGGLDMTFSAPKSVSLMGIMLGDDRVMEAHKQAVLKTLKIAESMAGCRVTSTGNTEHQITDNLLGARFDHELSRACDPQLHSHCVVINATQRADGEWRALDNEPLYRNKMLLGAAYRAELARELRSIGYEITVTHSDGRFELADWDANVLKEFSQRSRAIEDYLKANRAYPESASAVEKKLAALATRADKGDVDRDALAMVWAERLQDLGARIPDIPQPDASSDLTYTVDSAKEPLNRAIRHLSERESAFTKSELTCYALQFGVSETAYAYVVAEIERRIIEGTLLAHGDLLSTPELQKEESGLLAAELAERSALPHLCGAMPLALPASQLTDEQAEAVHAMVASNSRLIGMVGKAGTGKTTTLKSAVECFKASNLKVYGVAPSSNASRLLAEAGLETATVSLFNVKELYKKVAKGGVLIVDESGMLSTKQINALHQQAVKHDFRLVLVGDPKQLAAVEAGKPFAQLIKAGMPTTILSKIHRQKNAVLKAAVELASDGNTREAIRKIMPLVTEVPNRDQRLESIAAAYAQLSPGERKETIVVAGTRAARERINQTVRSKLGLTGTGMVVKILEGKNLTKQQAASISSYESGDILTVNRDYKSLGMKRGDQLTVTGINSASVQVTAADGRSIAWRPALVTDLTASTAAEREIAVGDHLRSTSNMHSLGLINGDEFCVTAVDHEHQTCTVELANGSKKELDLSRPLAIDHAYCKTVYASQGATCDRVFIEADTASLTAHQSTFYVALSRARIEAKIFTNDAEALGPAMSRNMEKKSALDIVHKVGDVVEMA